ncbi:MAG: glycosyltransferase [Pseudomonadota bacterium]
MTGVALSQEPVTVALPCLNEASRVRAAITSLLQDPYSEHCRFLLVDGGSTDGTLDIVSNTFGDRVEIIHNPRRVQAHGVNIAARIAGDSGAKYMLRADLHAIYPVPFLSVLIDTIRAQDADSVVVPMRTLGGNAVQNAASLIYSSWLGNGGSQHRTGTYRGWIDHGHHALFRIDAFLKTGGYDSEFAANEDAEFDTRLVLQGGRIFMENRVQVGYTPRATYWATARQFARNGRFRLWTAFKTKTKLGLRQILPLSILPVLVLSCLASFLWPWMLAVPLIYAVALVGVALASQRAAPVSGSTGLVARAALLAAITHISFSAGALRGAVELGLTHPQLRTRLRARQHTGTEV